jgi:hypothetical protein
LKEAAGVALFSVKSVLPEIVKGLIARTAFPEFVIVVLSVEVVLTVTAPKLSTSGVTPISGAVGGGVTTGSRLDPAAAGGLICDVSPLLRT